MNVNDTVCIETLRIICGDYEPLRQDFAETARTLNARGYVGPRGVYWNGLDVRKVFEAYIAK